MGIRISHKGKPFEPVEKVMKKDKKFQRLMKEIKSRMKEGENMEEYFLGKDPRKTKYYKQMMKK